MNIPVCLEKWKSEMHFIGILMSFSLWNEFIEIQNVKWYRLLRSAFAINHSILLYNIHIYRIIDTKLEISINRSTYNTPTYIISWIFSTLIHIINMIIILIGMDWCHFYLLHRINTEYTYIERVNMYDNMHDKLLWHYSFPALPSRKKVTEKTKY